MSATAKRPWDGVVSEADLEVYRKAGFGRTGGLGKRPVLLVIDVQYRTVGNTPKPILESLQDYPTSCGEYGWRAVSQIEKLVQVFRRHKLPIIYPSIAPKTPRDMGRFANKMPSAPQDNPKAFEIVESIAPAPDDIILYKHFSSAFFGTALATHLVRLGADSLVLTGCTTSGCVRRVFARLPHRRPRRRGLRSWAGVARGKPVRHRQQVRRRRADRRGRADCRKSRTAGVRAMHTAPPIRAAS